jgi:hypothetical protein
MQTLARGATSFLVVLALAASWTGRTKLTGALVAKMDVLRRIIKES